MRAAVQLGMTIARSKLTAVSYISPT